MNNNSPRSWRVSVSTRLAPCLFALLGACDDDSKSPHGQIMDPVNIPDAAVDAGPGPSDDAGTPPDDAGPDEPEKYGPLTVDTKAKDQNLDLFGVPGHHFWLEVSDEQLAAINEGKGEPQPPGGPWIDDAPIDEGGGTPGLDPVPPLPLDAGAAPDGGAGDGDMGDGDVGDGDVGDGDVGDGDGDGEFDAGVLPPWPNDGDNPYTPGDTGDKTFVDHLVIQDAKTSSVADYGKVEVKLVGESTRRPWDKSNIPNLRFDTDEFKKGRLVGTFEHFRLNNSEIGSIYREHIAHRIYRAMGYPALRTSYGFVGSKVWGKKTWIPMTLMEVYKQRFCEDNKELLGGTCKNIWEFPGDAGTMSMGPDACQMGTCDNAALDKLSDALNKAPKGEGFKEAMSGIIDWPHFHQFQCMSWIMWTGDDALHNMNNNLIIEREDGKLVWAPYSVDISAGQSWYQDTPLYGGSTISQRCQSDPTCWKDAVATCEGMIKKFDELNPELIVDDVHQTLTKLGMIRPYDDERAAWIRQWYVIRQHKLARELERYREPMGENGCPLGQDRCGDGECGTPEQCETRRCPNWQEWCDSAGACLDQGMECPNCEGETPFYCSVNSSCVTDVAACSALCGPGYEYCAAWRYCIGVGEPCGDFMGGDGDGDGPIPID